MCKNALFSAKNFITKVVYIVVCVSVIVWVLTNFNFRFNYIPNGTQNILPSMAKLIAPLFSPLGFASVGVVCSLLAGIVAKDLILSSMVIMDAKSQLKSTQLSIQAISDSLNFANMSFFGKYFKRHVGMSPLEYRNNG